MRYTHCEVSCQSFYWILDKKTPTPVDGGPQILWARAAPQHWTFLASGSWGFQAPPPVAGCITVRGVQGLSLSLVQGGSSSHPAAQGPALLTPDLLGETGQGQAPTHDQPSLNQACSGHRCSSQPQVLSQHLRTCNASWTTVPGHGDSAFSPALGLA